MSCIEIAEGKTKCNEMILWNTERPPRGGAGVMRAARAWCRGSADDVAGKYMS